MTLDQFLQFLRSQKLERAAELVAKYPDVVEPFLPKIAERLRAKGLIPQASTLPAKKPSRAFETDGRWVSRSLSLSSMKKNAHDILGSRLGNFRLTTKKEFVGNNLIKATATIYREDKSKMVEASFLAALSGTVPVTYAPNGARVRAMDPKGVEKTGFLDWKAEDRHESKDVYVRQGRNGSVTGSGFPIAPTSNVVIDDHQEKTATLAEVQAVAIAIALAYECANGIKTSCKSEGANEPGWPPKARAKNGEYNSKEFHRAIYDILKQPEFPKLLKRAEKAQEFIKNAVSSRRKVKYPIPELDGSEWARDVQTGINQLVSYIQDRPAGYHVTYDAAGAKVAKALVLEHATQAVESLERKADPSIWAAKTENATIEAAKKAKIRPEDLVWILTLLYGRDLPRTPKWGRFDQGETIAEALLSGKTTIPKIEAEQEAEKKKESAEKIQREVDHLKSWQVAWNVISKMAAQGMKPVLANFTRQFKNIGVDVKLGRYQRNRGSAYGLYMENRDRHTGPLKGWRLIGPELSSPEAAIFGFVLAARDIGNLPVPAVDSANFISSMIDRSDKAEQRGRQIWDALASGAL